jgi:hypothetical protein
MTDKISVAGWSTLPNDSTIASLNGAVLNVIVSAIIGPGPAPWGELFRFARVINVDASHTTCIRCKCQARWKIAVEWETGYVSPDGDIVCESCVDGVVIAGEHHLKFGDRAPESEY